MPILPAVRDEANRSYRTMNETRLLRALREQRTWFLAAVLWMPGDVDIARVQTELRRMRELGFNAVRYFTVNPEPLPGGGYDFSRMDAWMDAAQEEGMRVILSVSAITRMREDVLARHGLTPERFAKIHRDDDASRAALREQIGPVAAHAATHPAMLAWGGIGEPNPALDIVDPDYDREHFAAWLKTEHGSLDALNRAWELYPCAAHPLVTSFADAFDLCGGLTGPERLSGAHNAHVNYGAARDWRRYLTDKSLAQARAVKETVEAFAPDHPFSTGSHQFFANQAAFCWDIPRWARLTDMHHSSIHLSWHFDLVKGEVDRPVYMQARCTSDYVKGGWTSAHETTGGPVQYSGGYGVGMSAGLMRRLMLLYLAGNNQNIAFWSWSHRPGGWEGGEYGLTSLSGRLTPWAEEAGRVGQAMARYHGELWEAEQDAPVGILESWDTQAMLACEPERHDLQDGVGLLGRGTAMQHSRARIGAARALLNHHVPFEYVVTNELAEGIACRYDTLILPHIRSLDAETFARLSAYVEAGGHVIADVGTGYADPWGKLHPAGEEGPMARLFGAWIDQIHDARTAPQMWNGAPVPGCFGDLVVTDATPIGWFAEGGIAISTRTHGRGRATLVAFDIALACHAPGQEVFERTLADLARSGNAPRWRCGAPLAFRQRAGRVDHYFLVNDGPTMTTFLEVYDTVYTDGVDAITGAELPHGGWIPVSLPARSGRWLRFRQDR